MGRNSVNGAARWRNDAAQLELIVLGMMLCLTLSGIEAVHVDAMKASPGENDEGAICSDCVDPATATAGDLESASGAVVHYSGFGPDWKCMKVWGGGDTLFTLRQMYRKWQKLPNIENARAGVYTHRGWNYTVDRHGRVTQVDCSSVQSAGTSGGQDTNIYISQYRNAVGIKGDTSGHLRARMLGGDVDPLNIAPSAQHLNDGCYEDAERAVMRILVAGCDVQVNIKMYYQAWSKDNSAVDNYRPVRFIYTPTVIGPSRAGLCREGDHDSVRDDPYNPKEPCYNTPRRRRRPRRSQSSTENPANDDAEEHDLVSNLLEL